LPQATHGAAIFILYAKSLVEVNQAILAWSFNYLAFQFFLLSDTTVVVKTNPQKAQNCHSIPKGKKILINV
jgi:hypothetical protein